MVRILIEWINYNIQMLIKHSLKFFDTNLHLKFTTCSAN